MQFISLGLYFIAFVVSLEVRKIKFTVLRSYDFVPNNEHNELKDTTIISPLQYLWVFDMKRFQKLLELGSSKMCDCLQSCEQALPSNLLKMALTYVLEKMKAIFLLWT